jgi:hypothetical protein
MTPWLQNHALAEAECRLGWTFEDYVAEVLRARGLDVEQPPKSWRATVSDRHKYANELDLLVNGLRFSVKSRRVEFTGDPASIPDNRNPLFVDTVRKWDQRTPEPAAVVCISQFTKGIIWTPVADKQYWRTRFRFDNVRGFSQDFLVADRQLWRPLDDLVHQTHHVWDGHWKVKTGVLGVARNRVVREDTDPKLRHLVGTPFHLVIRHASAKPERAA